MVGKLNIHPGICPQVFNSLKKEVAQWNDRKKMCSIIFDEIPLKSNLMYDKHKDLIHGFVEYPEKKREFIDRALVFMVRGAVYKWQVPIAFYYCQGVSGIELKQIIKDIVAAVGRCGLKPLALICDQGTVFQAALKSLKKDTEQRLLLRNQKPDDRVIIHGLHLNIIFDPSHLVRGLRNHFLNKNIKSDGNISKWSDMLEIYQLGRASGLLRELSDQHVIPEKIKINNVRRAVKVFYRDMAAILLFTSNIHASLNDKIDNNNTLKNTGYTVKFINELYHSLNGTATLSNDNGKVPRSAIIKKGPRHKFWKDSLKTLEDLKFIDPTGAEITVPTVKNFIVTVKSFMRMLRFYKKQGIVKMRPWYFKLDAIENFFKEVRSYDKNSYPNCHRFKVIFKSLLIAKLDNDFDCKNDPGEQLSEQEVVQADHSKNNIEKIVQQARRLRIHTCSRAYKAGWAIRKILATLKIDCQRCKSCLKSDTNIHNWISYREYNAARKKRLFPSVHAVKCFATVVWETNKYLDQNPHETNISVRIKDAVMSKYSFDFLDCADHRDVVLNHFVMFTVRCAIYNWCDVVNNVLEGKRVHRLKNKKNLPFMQKKLLEHFQKKFKKYNEI